MTKEGNSKITQKFYCITFFEFCWSLKTTSCDIKLLVCVYLSNVSTVF